MQDTDRVVRQSGALQYIDLTPTTAPSWAPAPVARLARGTILPTVARPEEQATTRFERVVAQLPTRRAVPMRGLEEALSLGVRELAPPRRWGRVLAVRLDGEPAAVAAPAPRPRRAAAPAAVVAALTAIVVVLFAAWMQGGAASDAAPAPAPVAAPAPAPSVVTITPLPDPVEPVEAEVIEMPALAAPAPAPAPAPRPARRVTAPVGMTGGEGIVMIGAKPPCRILVDGKDTGLTTPVRDLQLPAGDHEITLVNDEFSIEDHQTITVKAGAPTRLVRDLTDRLPPG